jgi:hypothetical protein
MLDRNKSIETQYPRLLQEVGGIILSTKSSIANITNLIEMFIERRRDSQSRRVGTAH